MIKKLMKYDLMNIGKLLVYLYAVAIATCGITRLVGLISDIQVFAFLEGFLKVLSIAAIAAVLVVTCVQILKVFIHSFYKDESYLTHTLPVKKEKLLLSKYLSSLIMILISGLVSILCLLILYYTKDSFMMIKMVFESELAVFNMPFGGFVALMLFIIFFQICNMLSMTFAAVIKGCSFNDSRIFHGLIWFLIFYFGAMIVMMGAQFVIFLILGSLGDFFANTLSPSTFISVLLLCGVLYGLFSVAFYLIGQREFKKGVNVE